MITSSFFKNTLAGFALGLTVASLHALPEIDPKELALVSQIREKILAAKKDSPTPLAAYTEKIPGTDVSFALQPIPAGAFTVGSPASEKNRNSDEGPQAKVTVGAFWMGQKEVTWNEYEIFMFATDAAGNGSKGEADAVSHPTKPTSR